MQVLTIDDISIKIMQEPQLRKKLVDTFAKVIDSMIASDFDDKSVGRTFRILYDFKYMARPKVLAYTINETDFLECLLEQLPKLYFRDEVIQRENHISFDSSIFKQGLYSIETQMTKVFKAFFKEVDSFNVARNRKLMSAFIAFFEDIDKRVKVSSSVGFFAVPLHRIFGFYLTRLLMHNYLADSESLSAQGKKPSQIFRDIMRKYVEVPA